MGNLHMDHEPDGMSPNLVMSEEHDSGEGEFFDLQPPPSSAKQVKVEDIMRRLFSAEHLHFILADHSLFYKFSSFLNRCKPNLVPNLIRYLELRKAMKAIEYANSVVRSIRWPSHTDSHKFSRLQAASTDVRVEDYAARELLLLCSEALPAFVTHTLIGVVTDCVSRDITGQGIPIMRDLVGSLGEVFCLTDPSVHDNPIVFASEEFHRTTQYGTSYAIDRNCRFLQGPGTDKDALLRLAKAITLGQESNEVILNYRRDGTPFVNLLMCSPLYDDKGIIRYFIGAQVDVTGLVIDGLGIESFRALLHNDEVQEMEASLEAASPHLQSKFSPRYQSPKTKESLQRLQELSTMFSQDESDVACKNGRSCDDSNDGASIRSSVTNSVKARGQSKRVIGGDDIGPDGIVLNFSHLHLKNPSPRHNNLPGVYKHYLLVRPYPSLQIIFASPSLRLPGLLRTHLFTKLGGSNQTISALEAAFRDGASATAKVLWLPKNASPGEQRGRGPAEVKVRFIRCTPLLGNDDRVGVWMVILVPVDGESPIHNGYGRDEMVDEMGETRKRSGAGSRTGSSRRTPSVEVEADGGFGLKKVRSIKSKMPSECGVGGGGGGDRKQTYRDTSVNRYGNGNSTMALSPDEKNERELYAEYMRTSTSTSTSTEGSSGSNRPD
ncbi:uncharacterized protein L3040_001445 [Drepanopeziza brunnea f. sp. 'multigermtubi']|uniref:White collar n=1 Tax=Marssonina brunnea f. sp. multigermtubi (strain MB_m1) TaxID=1072389 RepID=K1XVK1_MARBU|nr:white collar [Drepanopeziza brunnea f. sp. 'multigermtubi' MB_m1]EKD16704.1 white collar [Drepanopeziza brunnea f. sp. 'multigermtubi' MB_m1]KAJ5051670.1 hypothetical protein L3040_001445 [Drepanopeziza brunnea f. sp. 'multigermtubi']